MRLQPDIKREAGRAVEVPTSLLGNVVLFKFLFTALELFKLQENFLTFLTLIEIVLQFVQVKAFYRQWLNLFCLFVYFNSFIISGVSNLKYLHTILSA